MGQINMSDLQINLIVAGIVIILAVIFYNWLQQRRNQRNTKEAFENKYEDVLLEAEKERIEPKIKKELKIDSRVEPSIKDWEVEDPDNQLGQDYLDLANKEIEIIETDSQLEQHSLHEINKDIGIAEDDSQLQQYVDAVNERVKQGESVNNNAFDYVVNIQFKTNITVLYLVEILQRKVDFGKPVRWYGQKFIGGSWEEITIESGRNIEYKCLRACLQLVDRSGPVSEVSLSEFRDMVQEFAELNNAVTDNLDIGEAYSQAVLLDQFCAEVDIMIGINVISKDGGAFTGTKIRSLAEASGFKLEGGGIFNLQEENDDAKFILQNYETTPFLPENMRKMTTSGVTFLFDVPRIKNGDRVFDQMTSLAGTFASTLGGIMVDDNKVPLSDSGIDRIKHKLVEIYSAMESKNLPAGGEIALRLFV
ncbi:MAG: cell division protein FtsZ [Nitrosomonadaceae bacterium]|nr:cell division protein FtsZ [Nitrosomonadaceae bacterium]|tara:strand:- start:4104 stop:5366 length:1263 start_codon:yes stop_codon:yes gene_type:complete